MMWVAYCSYLTAGVYNADQCVPWKMNLMWSMLLGMSSLGLTSDLMAQLAARKVASVNCYITSHIQ